MGSLADRCAGRRGCCQLYFRRRNERRLDAERTSSGPEPEGFECDKPQFQSDTPLDPIDAQNGLGAIDSRGCLRPRRDRTDASGPSTGRYELVHDGRLVHGQFSEMVPCPVQTPCE